MSWQLAYAPEVVRRALLHFAEALPAYYQRALTEPAPVSPRVPPSTLLDRTLHLLRDATPPADESDLAQRIAALTDEFLANAQRLHSPHYVGHQVPAVAPVAALFDALAKATNQGLAVYEMGPFAMAAERALVRHLGERIGWNMDHADGIATSGGTLANMTALLSARHRRYRDAWRKGLPRDITPAVVCSADTHYSVARAAGILGIGTDHVLKVPVDLDRRMRGDALARTLDEARARGLDPFCVVASSSSTATGAFDDLPEIAPVCAARNIWLHVDGAHGASLLFSRQHRAVLAGIDAADSVTWDAHKMLFVPSLSTFLFYKNAAESYGTFEQDAPYIGWSDDERQMQALEPGRRTVECTKGGISLGLWGLIATCGDGVLEQLIDKTIATTRAFYDLMRASDDFEPLHVPQCNILCFRYLPSQLRGASPAAIGAFQKRLRAAVLTERSFYLTATVLDGVDALRVTIINPATELEHLAALLDELRRLGYSTL